MFVAKGLWKGRGRRFPGQKLARWFLLLGIFTPLPAQSDVIGLWATAENKSHVAIENCAAPLPGDQLCGKIVWLKDPTNDDGQPLVDKNNTDPALTSRPILGLPLLSGFKQSDEANVWEDGKIYNPEDGDTYQCTLTLLADGTLEVHGYVALPIFGKSQIWTAVTQ